MTRTLTAVVMVGMSVSGVVGAQSFSADEKAIRDLLAEWDSGRAIPEAEEAIFWSGALKRPRIGAKGKSELMPGEERRVSTRNKTTVRRLEVSQSGDMAYEFSDGLVTAEYKAADGKIETNTFTNSVLRVWKKVNGRWQVAALFARPHEN